MTRTPDAFNGDCSTANWAGASDACWSCLCGACKDTLNKCDTNCTGVLKCATEKQTLVNDANDLACEVRATAVACLAGDPALQAGASALITLDGCLFASKTKPAGQLRDCAAECGITYPGDVCQRFPASSGDGG